MTIEKESEAYAFRLLVEVFFFRCQVSSIHRRSEAVRLRLSSRSRHITGMRARLLLTASLASWAGPGRLAQLAWLS